jgi:hypothetical protein
MNTYTVFYNGKSDEIKAETSYAAQKAYAAKWNVRPNKHYLITPVLHTRADGSQVIHSTAGI